jgi:hypothetical protein
MLSIALHGSFGAWTITLIPPLGLARHLGEPNAQGDSRRAGHYDYHRISSIFSFGSVACQRLCLG